MTWKTPVFILFIYLDIQWRPQDNQWLFLSRWKWEWVKLLWKGHEEDKDIWHVDMILTDYLLTRAPLGYFYNAPHWGGGGLFRAPPLISETTGPILKIQTAFERPGKTVEGKQILLTSGSRVTSQVRSKSKCSTFRAWWHRRAKLRC